MHPLAGIHHRRLGGDQHGGGALDIHRIGAGFGAQHRRVVQRLGDLIVPHVAGNFDDAGAAAAVAQIGESATENVAHLVRQSDRFGGFRVRLHCLAGIEVRVDIGQSPGVAHRQHQHRHGLAIALRNPAHGVLRPGPVLHAKRANAVAGRDAGNRVGHMNANPLLPAHHRPDIGGGGVFDQMVDGIAAEDLDPLALHDFRDGVAEFHFYKPP